MNKDLIVKTTTIKENGKINFKSLGLNLTFDDFTKYKFYIWDKYGIDIYFNDFLDFHKNSHNSSRFEVHEMDENKNANFTKSRTISRG